MGGTRPSLEGIRFPGEGRACQGRETPGQPSPSKWGCQAQTCGHGEGPAASAKPNTVLPRGIINTTTYR